MSDYRKLYIIGAGGFDREMLWFAERINAYQKTWDVLVLKICLKWELVHKLFREREL